MVGMIVSQTMSWVVFQQMQIRKFLRLPHHSAVWWSLADMPFFVSFSHLVTALEFCPVARRDGAEQCFCVHPSSRDALWLSTLGLSRPVLLCPQSVSLSLTVSLFPSPLYMLGHSSHLFLSCWSRSDWGRGERRRGRQESQILSCADAFGLSLPTYLLLSLLLWFSILADYGKRWQSMGSNSEVGTFDRYVTHGFVTVKVSHRWCS